MQEKSSKIFESINSLVRAVRESQGISQGVIARSLKITPGAIAHFENRRSTLSKENIEKIAKILNLNSNFLEEHTGNPFRRKNEQTIIKMFLGENPAGETDFSLVHFIATHNGKASFIFIKPFLDLGKYRELFSRLRKTAPMKFAAVAILIQDEDKNIFLFRRKHIESFDAIHLMSFLKQQIIRVKKKFEIRFEKGPSNLFYLNLKKSELTTDDFNMFLASSDHKRNVEFLSALISSIWSQDLLHGTEQDTDEFKKINGIIRRMTPEELIRLREELTSEIKTIVKQHIK